MLSSFSACCFKSTSVQHQNIHGEVELSKSCITNLTHHSNIECMRKPRLGIMRICTTFHTATPRACDTMSRARAQSSCNAPSESAKSCGCNTRNTQCWYLAILTPEDAREKRLSVLYIPTSPQLNSAASRCAWIFSSAVSWRTLRGSTCQESAMMRWWKVRSRLKPEKLVHCKNIYSTMPCFWTRGPAWTVGTWTTWVKAFVDFPT